METRIYFLAGDTFSCALTGALAGLVCAIFIPAGWSMSPSMLVGMLIGMALSMPLAIVLGIFFGAMEVMIPVMVTGMAAGMALAMAAAGGPLALSTAAVRGAAIGICCLIATYLANAALRRSRTI
jgi:hypothetical protein